MADRKTKIVLEIKWDDEAQDHPMSWEWPMLVFGSLPADDIKLLDFEDLDEQESVIA